MMKLAVIPARGGSKRIPRKNIKLFCGRPMIVWSIEAALSSNCFDAVVVSTDDDEIAEIARRHGAQVPFVRPDVLADDMTSTAAVVAHAVQWFVDHGQAPDLVCCLYSTAPFVTAQSLRNGLEVLTRTGADYAFTVTSYGFPVQRAIRMTGAGRVEMVNPGEANTRSQDLEPIYHDAGQFYWGTARAWQQGKMIFGSSSVPILLPRYQVQDIDTPEDWQMAEFLFRAQEANANGTEHATGTKIHDL